MGVWGSEFISRRRDNGRLKKFQGVVNNLSPSARQAVVVAIEKFGTINKGTWNGCVFNAAGQVEGETVTSSYKAAQVFGMEQSEVQDFILTWDSLSGTNEDSTELLRQALDGADLWAPVGQAYEVRVWTSEATKQREAFEAMVADLDINDVTPETEEIVTQGAVMAELMNV